MSEKRSLVSRLLRPMLERVVGVADRAAFPEAAAAPEQWQRVVMNSEVDKHINALDPRRLSAVEISGTLHSGRPWREYAELSYPEFDLCAPLSEERRFDVVICEQVIEHVDDPLSAVRNLRELCRPGGDVIVSTPFLVKIHEHFGMRDLWRFTPRGLATLLTAAGLEVELLGSWGNRECVVGNFSRWSAFRPGRHSLRNEPEFPVQVWAFAKRPQ